jgi:hypothetical protein
MNIVGWVFVGILAAAALLGLALVITALPDIARYSRIRKM